MFINEDRLKCYVLQVLLNYVFEVFKLLVCDIDR